MPSAFVFGTHLPTVGMNPPPFVSNRIPEELFGAAFEPIVFGLASGANMSIV
jgi:hypothetical protein